MLAIPGAMHAGVGDILFWGALSVALVIAGVDRLPGQPLADHQGPRPRRAARDRHPRRAAHAAGGLRRRRGGGVRHQRSDRRGGRERQRRAASTAASIRRPRAAHEMGGQEPDAVRGLAVAENGLTLKVDQRELPRGRRAKLSFTVVGSDGRAGARLPGRAHQAGAPDRRPPRPDRLPAPASQAGQATAAGAPTSQIDDAGSYRVFADFKRRGENHTLAADVAVDGPLDSRADGCGDEHGRCRRRLPGRADRRRLEGRRGGRARLPGHPRRQAGRRRRLPGGQGPPGRATRGRHGLPPRPPGRGRPRGEAIEFATEFPSDGRYGLFLQFKHEGKVRTAAFTREVAR